jgi:[ribosomal protein S5]-alanine N-acetyltransferase
MNIDLETGFSLTEFRPDDADALVECLVDKEIHDRTLRIPFPYTPADAERWLGEIAATTKENGQPRQFALRNEAGRAVGAVGLEGAKLGESPRAEIGYWLAKPFWGRGLMTTAARAVCRHGFAAMGLAKITAHVFSWNDASARVLLKCGFEQEGFCRRHFLKDGQFIDVKLFGLLRP